MITSTAPPTNQLSIQVVWSPASDGVNQFFLYKNKQRVFPAPVAVTEFTDLNVVTGTQYCYYVTAVENGIESPPSVTKCVTP